MSKRVFSLVFRYFSVGVALCGCFGLAWAEKPKKIMIFYDYGGHKSAAFTIKELVEKADPTIEIEMVEFSNLAGPLERFVYRWFYPYLRRRHPRLVDPLYRVDIDTMGAARDFASIPLNHFAEVQSVYELIRRSKPDLIISTHFTFTDVLCYFRHLGLLTDIPIGWVHTDYVNELRFTNLSRAIDMTFLGTDRLRDQWIEAGIPEEKSATSGIPVSEAFLRSYSTEELLQTAARWQILSDRPVVTISGGSMGGLPYEDIVAKLARGFVGPAQLVVVAGKDNPVTEARLRAIANRTAPLRGGGFLPEVIQLTVIDFIPQEQLAQIIDLSTVLLLKPGGLMTTEASARGTPSVFLDTIGANEAVNAQEALAFGYGLHSQTVPGAVQHVLNVLGNPNLVPPLLEGQRRFASNIRPSVIRDWVMSGGSVQPMQDRVRATRRESSSMALTLTEQFTYRIFRLMFDLSRLRYQPPRSGCQAWFEAAD